MSEFVIVLNYSKWSISESKSFIFKLDFKHVIYVGKVSDNFVIHSNYYEYDHYYNFLLVIIYNIPFPSKFSTGACKFKLLNFCITFRFL